MDIPSRIEKNHRKRYESVASELKSILKEHLGQAEAAKYLPKEKDVLPDQQGYTFVSFVDHVIRAEEQDKGAPWDGEMLDFMILVLSPTKDSRAEKYFIQFYKNSNFEPVIRETAVKALSDYRSRETMETLIHALQENAEDVPFFAQVSLASMGNHAIPYLMSAYMEGIKVLQSGGETLNILNMIDTPLSQSVLELIKRGELEPSDNSKLRNTYTHFYG